MRYKKLLPPIFIIGLGGLGVMITGCRPDAERPIVDGYDIDGDGHSRGQPIFDVSNPPPSPSAGSDGGSPSESAPPGSPPQGGSLLPGLLDGPADALVIDNSVHPGGVWGEPFSFRMGDYPKTWAIALAHASLLLRSQGIDYSPNAVLAVAMKESRLGCLSPSFPNQDGCFQIESTTAYTELRRLFPERFSADHSETIQGGHFESSALSLVYYTLVAEGMFYLHSDNPTAFFQNHPDGVRALQKTLSAAYNRGFWWTGLDDIFAHCGNQEVTDCFEGHDVAIDHANAITDYTERLDAAEPYDVTLTPDDLRNYWDSIKALYPGTPEPAVLSSLPASFSFHENLKGILGQLISELPPLPPQEEVIGPLCGLGYLTRSPPCRNLPRQIRIARQGVSNDIDSRAIDGTTDATDCCILPTGGRSEIGSPGDDTP